MAGPVSVTQTGVGASRWVAFDPNITPTQISIACVLTGAATYQIEWAYETPAVNAVVDPIVQGVTANAVATSSEAVTYARIVITAGIGSVTGNFVQAGVTTGVATASGIPTTLTQTGTGSTRWVAFDPSVCPTDITIACVFSGSGTYQVEWAYDQPATTGFPDNYVQGASANAVATISSPVLFGRITVTGSATVIGTFIQSGAATSVIPAPRTTSGNTAFNPSALQIITEALALIRVGVDEEPLTASQTKDAMRSLNLMVKAWQADGLHLWTKTEGVIFLEYGVAQYKLGGNNNTRSCLYENLVDTTLAADGTAGDSTIVVGDASGMANGDQIGVEIGGNILQWTTVNGSPVGNTVTLTNPLDEDVLTGGAVFAYSTKLERPTRMLQARRRIYAPNRQDYNDIWLTIQERPDYYNQPTKQQAGTETMIYYDPQLTTGLMQLWQSPSNETDLVLFTFERPLEDFTSLPQTADFPQEWIETVAWNLAFRLAPKYSFPLDERTQIGVVAEQMKQKLLGFDREYGSVYFQPDYTSQGGFASYGMYSGGYGGSR